MGKSLWERIEAIREEPEHIRLRYVFGCLTFSMIFIIGIWMLSLEESFRNIKGTLPETIKTGKDLFPKEETPSLSDLLQKATPLHPDESKPLEGKDYFDAQMQK
ncbi:MAG: hypothetical protein GW815_03070 [Candidatus Moranbacteria bacterium]|nr:hypothetical protein [Candidatus Moranbacteria bacterium]OIQ03611.1 MAG: hypothetical protein AUK58_01645 [Candidatus Moranbacteria bacterium CG2_30_41_165]PIP25423.1 MAG: hypothetical protein COX32_03425 [Candidatus Moranbacteria bacterium CG23_combo_of_CG06-09_8_20_14_all_41_28]PIV86243.1 MAG: hypothetical protein COW50_02515 [Candidatus Moranbacteria bacterium CG17_big_fil_post_rev_8_21_14_2_50_41_107]PIW94461.1 MAG: hypothetical protein COZ86_01000 [Candidatus Moranbacteria bacterium CG_